MKNIITGIILLILTGFVPARAQQVVKAEYFFNQDPGVGNGTALEISASDSTGLTTSVSVEGLPVGFHRLAVRVQDDGGRWSFVENSLFYVYNTELIEGSPGDVSRLNAAEYFIDDDPGAGQGTPIEVSLTGTIENVTQTIDVSNLSLGNHTLSVRVGNKFGTWSTPLSETFTIASLTSVEDDLAMGKLLYYPNPAQGQMTVKLENEYFGPVNIRLLDITGKERYSQQGMKSQLEWQQSLQVGRLSTGMYLLEITTGQQRQVVRISKQ